MIAAFSKYTKFVFIKRTYFAMARNISIENKNIGSFAGVFIEGGIVRSTHIDYVFIIKKFLLN